MSVAAWSGAFLRWDEELAAFKSRLAAVFRRLEVRGSAGAFIDGLLSGVSRKTGWQLAEQAGLAVPIVSNPSSGAVPGMRVRYAIFVRGEVLDSLGDVDGVLVVDETGFLKKGTHSGRGCAAIFRHPRTSGELSGWCFSWLCQPFRSGTD
jgi:SRSO17 transposase